MNNMLRDLKDVKRIRTRLSLTQTELAEKAGVSQSLIAKIEKGDAVPSYEKGRAILDALDSVIMSRSTTIRAEDIHTSEMVYVSPDDTIGTALKMMKERAVSQIPVMDDNVSVGGLTERCLLSKFDKLDRSRPVRNVMEEPFPIIPTNSSVEMVKELLVYYPSVLTSEGGKIKGIITKADLLEEILVDNK